MFHRLSQRPILRRGVSAVQAALVLVLVTVVAGVGMRLLSQNASTDMNSTAAGISDPAQLADRFLD